MGSSLTSPGKEQSGSELVPKYRWAILFASFLAFVAFAFAFQSAPPLFMRFQASFGIDGAQSGLLMSMVVIPGILLAVPAGFIVNRYGFYLVGFLSIVSVIIGNLLTALANSYVVALFGRFILGVGGAFIVVGTPSVIPQWFRHPDLGKAMGIYATNMPVATIVAFGTSSILSQQFDWRYPFHVGTVLAIVTAAVFVMVMKEGPLKDERNPLKTEEVRQAIENLEVWKAGVIWLFFNATAIGFVSWGGTLFEEFRGLDAFRANLLASTLMIVAALFVPVFGWASDKLGRRKPFIVMGSLSMALSLVSVAVAYNLSLYVSVSFLGISASMVPPLTMAVVGEDLPSKLTGVGFSIITLCQNLGITMAAPLVGLLLQTSHSILPTLSGLSVFAIASMLIALTLKSR